MWSFNEKKDQCIKVLILYPLVIILASWLGLDQAASLVTDVASVFVVASSGIIVGYMGVNAIREKNQ